MKTAHTHGILLLAAINVIGLTACGGDDQLVSSVATEPTPAAPTPHGGGSEDGGSGPPPPVWDPGSQLVSGCAPDRYWLTLSLSPAVVGDQPRTARLLVNCGGNVAVVANAAIDWTVTAGGGSVNGSTTARTTTASDGTSEVSWRFGSGDEVQSIEARLNEVSPSLHAALSHTVLAAGPNPCEASGGTDLGENHTVSTDTSWTRAGSPYFQCPDSMPCAGEVTVSGGAVLTIEPGVAICVNKIRTADAGRIVAAGTRDKPVHFGVRNRASEWGGLVFQGPVFGSSFSGASILRHTVIENPSGIDVSAHPVLVEDTLIRRDSALIVALAALQESGAGGGPTFAIGQHRIDGIPPSHVVRTVIDAFGGPPGAWDYGPGSPAVRLEISAATVPLVISARVINSQGPGVEIVVGGLANGNETLLTNCEISGSAEMGLYVNADPAAASLSRIRSCNVFGNAGAGVENYTPMQLDARGNWWGDPTGPLGPKGDGAFGRVDASDPLAAPVDLGY